MRTAIFVYEPSSITIHTDETGAELSGLTTGNALLACGDSAHSLAPGIYKVVSNNSVKLSGQITALDVVVTTENKENNPIPPLRAEPMVASIDPPALSAFFAVPAAKELANP